MEAYITLVHLRLDDAVREILCDIASEQYKHVLIVGRSWDEIYRVILPSVTRQTYLFNSVVSSPTYFPLKTQLKFSNGAEIRFLSAESPDRMLGIHTDLICAYLPKAWEHPEAFEMMRMGNRLGPRPKEIEITA